MSCVGRNGPSVTCGGDGGGLGEVWREQVGAMEFQLGSGSSLKPENF